MELLLFSKTHWVSHTRRTTGLPAARSNAKFFALPKQLLRACELVKPCKLEDVSHRLGEAVLDPLMWPVLMEDICMPGSEARGALRVGCDTLEVEPF